MTGGAADDSLTASTVLTVPARLAPDCTARDRSTVDLPVTGTVRVPAAADRVETGLTVGNTAEDHRLRLRFPTGIASAQSVAETAYGVIRRLREEPDADGWRDRSTGARAMRRFAALEDDKAGLAVLTEGLYEYAHPEPDVLDVTCCGRWAGWRGRIIRCGRTRSARCCRLRARSARAGTRSVWRCARTAAGLHTRGVPHR